MILKKRLSLFTILLCFVITGLLGCAQIQVQSNKARGYSGTLDKLAVWSAVGSVPVLGEKSWFKSSTYEALFHTSLKNGLASAGVSSDIRAFRPSVDTMESLSRFETKLSPSMRLLITPKSSTHTSRGGVKILTYVVFDLSLYEISSGSRVWRAQITADDPIASAFSWDEDRANQLTQKILDALNKDNLLPKAPATQSLKNQP